MSLIKNKVGTTTTIESSKKKSDIEQTLTEVSLYGCVRHPQFIIAKEILESLYKTLPHLFTKSDFNLIPLCDLEYRDFRHKKKKQANIVDNLFPSIIVQVEKKLKINNNVEKIEHFNLPDFLIYLKKTLPNFNFETEKSEEEYNNEAGILFLKTLGKLENPLVFVNISIDNLHAGKIIIELFRDKVPKIVDQFLSFVEPKDSNGPSYLNTSFSRLVARGWIQGGEIMKVDEEGIEELICEPLVEDENFIVKHDRRGIISMINQGPNSNVSAFMILLSEGMEYFDKKYVAFGRVLEGEGTLNNIEMVETRFERPVKDIKISEIGIYRV
ncbi:putative inactive peptidyl-prolyl cis-trans isomerase-like 6 [Clydaea vesicula]|uniref:peptidylprolyl isomerase n=1 Tax=Clydaea vesicula TaxID=447962 RepID=A0AAD5XW90_9FUNG|nr:putative inactive peptidyl-prolyl cis-trans isomerase-like 6 [Clydaea vesicula]